MISTVSNDDSLSSIPFDALQTPEKKLEEEKRSETSQLNQTTSSNFSMKNALRNAKNTAREAKDPNDAITKLKREIDMLSKQV